MQHSRSCDIVVGKVQLMKQLPSTSDMCVWVNNRNSTMFLVTRKKLSLLKIPTYTHSHSYL